jgi:hypothetical protein
VTSLPCCSICRGEIAEGPGLTIAVANGVGRSNVGLYDSERCATAARALLALDASIPVGASREFRDRRAAISDALVEAWRRGGGPDPATVLAAADRARAAASSTVDQDENRL